MSNLLGGLGDLAEKSAGEALAFGLGFALGRALEPAGVALVQETWKVAPIRAPEAELLAEGVAQGHVDRDRAAEWASEHGYGAEAFATLVEIAKTGPALGMAFEAWRRGELTEAELELALLRQGIEAEWHPALKALKENPLEPAEIAKAIHRGIMRGAGLLVAVPSDVPGRVPAVPPSELDPVAEAAWSGIDKERLRIMTGNAGLPPGIVQMLELLNRGAIEEPDFERGVAESNLRNEWAPALLELRRRLLTPHEYVEGRLRGWIDDGAMHAGAALSGMEAADTDLLAKLSGRPLSWHQVFIGLRRGGAYDGPTEAIDPAFLKALQESNIRPEWYALAWSQRYAYPAPFVLRALVTGGDLTAAEGETILLYQGWEPGLAKKVAAKWAGSVAGAGKEETKAELADEYAGGYLSEQEFRAALEALGYTGHVQDLLIHLGDAKRIKAWREKAVNAVNAGYLAGAIDDTGAIADLAELNITGEAASMLVLLWAKQKKYKAA